MPQTATLIHSLKLAGMRVLEAAPDAIGSVSSVRTRAGHVIFTYDDGPTPVRTPAVLRALAEHRATATFFVLMTSVRDNPSLLAEVMDAGHEIGLHGIDHRHLSQLPPRLVEDNLRRGKAELEDVIGRQVRWFRPPYGDQSIGAWRAIKRTGMESVIWSSTSWDWNPDVDNDTRVRMAGMSLAAGRSCCCTTVSPAPGNSPTSWWNRCWTATTCPTGCCRCAPTRAWPGAAWPTPWPPAAGW